MHRTNNASPTDPAAGELSDEQLETVAGGVYRFAYGARGNELSQLNSATQMQVTEANDAEARTNATMSSFKKLLAELRGG